MSKKDEAREERIYEVIADANDSEERAMGWYCYLDDRISFPFAAECVAADKRSPLELREQITVLRMSDENYCGHDIYVDISWKGKPLSIPLAQIEPLDDGEDTAEAVGDWRYWKNQGNEF
ncbi:MAG: calcium-binding protein [Clostridiales bacterium]|jgi:hypothetical protein|nr:calcium-binding protein [Clostridiales bacterium]